MLSLQETSIYAFYDTYTIWCREHDFPALHPENVDTCFILYKDATPIYSTFFWHTGSKMCLVGFPLSNPSIDYKDRKGALDFLFNELSDYARHSGYNLMWTTSGTERVIESLERTNFTKGDRNVHQYIKILN